MQYQELQFFHYENCISNVCFLSVCDVKMGLSNGLIVSNAQFKASSVMDSFHGAERARLYTHRDGALAGGWTPR